MAACRRPKDGCRCLSDRLRRPFRVAATATKAGKGQAVCGGRSIEMITESEQRESRYALLGDKKKVRSRVPLVDRILRPLDTSGRGRMADRGGQFHRQAVMRLFLAIVNQAIFDVLERGENSLAAEKWLLSRDFDRLQELFG